MHETTTWVYQYRYWDPHADTFVVSKDMATLEAIKNGLGVALLASGVSVPMWMVKPSGHVDAAATSED